MFVRKFDALVGPLPFCEDIIYGRLLRPFRPGLQDFQARHVRNGVRVCPRSSLRQQRRSLTRSPSNIHNDDICCRFWVRLVLNVILPRSLLLPLFWQQPLVIQRVHRTHIFSKFLNIGCIGCAIPRPGRPWLQARVNATFTSNIVGFTVQVGRSGAAGQKLGEEDEEVVDHERDVGAAAAVAAAEIDDGADRTRPTAPTRTIWTPVMYLCSSCFRQRRYKLFGPFKYGLSLCRGVNSQVEVLFMRTLPCPCHAPLTMPILSDSISKHRRCLTSDCRPDRPRNREVDAPSLLLGEEEEVGRYTNGFSGSSGPLHGTTLPVQPVQQRAWTLGPGSPGHLA